MPAHALQSRSSCFPTTKGNERERESGKETEKKKFRKGESSFSTTRQCRGIENEVAAEFSFPRDIVVCFPPPLSLSLLLVLTPVYTYVCVASSSPYSILRHPLPSLRSVSLARATRCTLLALVLPACARCDALVPFSRLFSTSSLPLSPALIREHCPLVSVRGEREIKLCYCAKILRRKETSFLCV